MRIAIFLLLVGFLQTQANDAYSQNTKLSISFSNTELVKVLDKIENESQFYFLYNEKLIDATRKVSIEVKDVRMDEVLKKLFSGTDVEYSIIDRKIVLSPAYLSGAQQSEKKITGKVTDSTGATLPGVSVVVKGTAKGVVTEDDGSYTIDNIPSDAVLRFSYMGMKTQEINTTDKTEIDVKLFDEPIGVNEFVVTALGIKKEAKSLSYNVQQLTGSDVNKVTDANFVNSLNGKVAGVTINSSSAGVGGSSRVVMRGAKSINGNNNALYVIDGIPMPNLSSGQPSDIFSGAGQTGDGVSNLNSDDIESISVLSGPSAAALYGSSAANGVVLVTTKRGQKDIMTINLVNSTTFSAPLILPKFQNTYGPSEAGSYYSWGDKLTTPSKYDPADFFQTGVNSTTTASLSTGSDRNQTYVSFGNVNSKGIIHNNNYDRNNFSVNNTSNFLNKKMTMDLGFMVSSVQEQNMISQGQYFNPLIPVYLFPAGDDFSKAQIYQRYNASRNFQTQYWPYGDQGMSMQNPYWITENDKFINKKNRYMANAKLKYEFANWINLSGRVKLDQNNDRYEKKFNASTNTLFASENGYYSLNETETRQIYGEALLSINKYFNGEMLNLTANIGSSFEDIIYNQDLFGGKLAGVANLFTYGNINQLAEDASQSGYHKKKQAVFASAQLGYKSLVYLDVTARNDWSSTLAGTGAKSFFYPTAGLSGIITDIFKCSTDLMTYMKLRVSYSEVGNDPDQFFTNPTYELGKGLPIKYTMKPTGLKPERTKSWEVGTNFVFFKSKLKVDATFYKSSTYNQFFKPELSVASGFKNAIVNGGRIDNKGIEISARYNDTFGKFKWGSYLTYSLNRNEIVELLHGWKNPVTGEIITMTKMDMGGTGSYKMMLKEGGAMGDIYVSTLKTDDHGAIYVDPSNYTVVADANTYVYAGNSAPKYNLGFGNDLSWKGISLGVLFTARVGGIVVSNTQAIMDAFGASKASADARDAGGALVNGKLIPAKEYYQTVGGGSSGGIASMYCYSATNVRLSELTLGYDVPVNKYCKWVKGLNISFVGRNLFLIYNKAPYDPELTANTGTYSQGLDYFMQPSLRNLGFSVKLQF